MTVNWLVSDSVCISHWGSASGSLSRLTDGAFNWLHRRGTNVGQSSEELMQNNRGLLFLTEGPPLDQIIGQAVDISLPSIVSAEGRRTISHTHADAFHLARLSFLLIYLRARVLQLSLALFSHAFLVTCAMKINITAVTQSSKLKRATTSSVHTAFAHASSQIMYSISFSWRKKQAFIWKKLLLLTCLDLYFMFLYVWYDYLIIHFVNLFNTMVEKEPHRFLWQRT